MKPSFVWYDLNTTDAAGAKRFYTELVGWKLKSFGGGGEGYEMWDAGDTQVGGVMALSAEARAAGARPAWVGYVATANVDATLKKAEELGGSVIVPGTDIPEVGRFAYLADPQGATFAIFQPKEPEAGEPPAMDVPGHLGWAELNTTDWEAAWKFYAALFGWKPTSQMDMGPELGAYFMFGVEPGKSIGGMSNAARMMKMPPHWLHYVTVRNADEAAKRIPALGGRVLNGPMDVPGGGRIAQCMDPQGAAFAIYSEK